MTNAKQNNQSVTGIMEIIPCKDRHEEKPHVKCGCGLRKHEHCRFCGEVW